MNPQIARLALQFLDRTQISGAEVEAFMAVRHELSNLALPTPAVEGPEFQDPPVPE